MSPIGKEIEHRINTPDIVAVREVENYIEKVEKSTELSGQDNQNSNQNPSQSNLSFKASQQASLNSVVPAKKIVLPINESSLTSALKKEPNSGIRWLAEWCLMMIKKYPGRVFYSSSNNSYD